MKNGKPNDLVSFEYRGDDGKPQVRRVRPSPGSLEIGKGGWFFIGTDIDAKAPCVILLSRIVVFYGLPDLREKSPRRNSDGTLAEAKA